MASGALGASGCHLGVSWVSPGYRYRTATIAVRPSYSLKEGDLVAATGDIEHTREIWDDTAERYLIRVKVTVSLMSRVRVPAPGIAEGWITLFPEGHSMGGNITHMTRGPSFIQPDTVLEWFAGRYHCLERIGRIPAHAPPGDRVPRTPSPGTNRATSSTHRHKRQASEAGI
jgi:hypothetical protein